MAAKLAHEIKYQKFDENNVNHVVIRDRILEEYGLLDEATISRQKYMGDEIILKSSATKSFLQLTGAKEGDIFTIVSYDASAPTYGTGDGKTTIQDSNGNKFTILNSGDVPFFTHNKSGGDKKPKSEWYEMGIAVAYNMMKNNISEDEALKMAQITGGNLKNYQDTRAFLLPVGEKIAKDLSVGGKMIHFGNATGITNWSGWSGKDTTPKTDILGDSYNVSLKMGSSNMIANPNRDEAIDTLKAALKYFDENESTALAKEINSITSEISKEWKDVPKIVKISELKKNALEDYTKFRVDQLKKSTNYKNYKVKELEKHAQAEAKALGIASGSPKEQDILADITDGAEAVQTYLSMVRSSGINKSELKEELAIGLESSIANRKWSDKLGKLFSDNPDYKKWLVFEAMTGQVKFTGNAKPDVMGAPAPVANWMLKAMENGAVKVNQVITPTFAAKYAQSVTSRVSFKHNKGAMFLEVKKQLSESEESTENFFDTIFEEEYTKYQNRIDEYYENSVEGLLLNEGFKDFMKNVKSTASKVVKNIMNSLETFYNEFILGVINKVVNKIIEIAKKGYTSLMEVLGYEISSGDVAFSN